MGEELVDWVRTGVQGRRTEPGLGSPSAWMDTGIVRGGHTILGGPKCWGQTEKSSICTELRNQGLGPQLTQGQRTCGVRNQEARVNTLFNRRLVKFGMLSSVTGTCIWRYMPFRGVSGKMASPSQLNPSLREREEHQGAQP